MFNLMKNEYIKIFYNTANRILFITVLIIFILFQAVCKTSISTPIEEGITLEYINHQITYLRNAEPSNYKSQIAMYQFMKKHKIYGNVSQWKLDALEEAYHYDALISSNTQLPPRQLAEYYRYFKILTESVSQSNWEEYLTLKIEQTQLNFSGSESEQKSLIQFYETMIFYNVEPGTDNWKEDVIEEIRTCQQALEELNYYQFTNLLDDEAAWMEAYNHLSIAQYRLDNDIDVHMSAYHNPDTPFWNVLLNSQDLLILVYVVMVILAGGSIAQEFSRGTIKLYLINPVKRSKLFFSKYFTLTSLSVIFLSLACFLNLLLTCLCFPSNHMSAPYLYVSSGVVYSYPALFIIIRTYLVSLIPLLVIMTSAFMISSLLHSSSMAIGISMAFLFGGSALSYGIGALHLDWGRYILFSNLNLSNIANGSSQFAHHTVQFACIVILINMAIFLLTAYDGFVRQDV